MDNSFLWTPPPKDFNACENLCAPDAFCHQIENSLYHLCNCNPGYHGDPYEECVMPCQNDVDCHNNRSCISEFCKNPCVGFSCEKETYCKTVNHAPACTKSRIGVSE